MANNRWIQQGSATTPSGAQYGDDVILKDGSFFVVDENGNLIGLMPKGGGTFDGQVIFGGSVLAHYRSSGRSRTLYDLNSRA